jgi:hypothetical protein
MKRGVRVAFKWACSFFIIALSSFAINAQSVFDDTPPRPTNSGTPPRSTGTPPRFTGTPPSQRPTTRPSSTLRPRPIPEQIYLFPPISWEEATQGVIPLTTAGAQDAAKREAPADQKLSPGVAALRATVIPDLPPISPADADAVRRHYVPLITAQQVKDYQTVYGADEERAAGKPAELLRLIQTLRTAAADTTDRPDLQRYLLLRAFLAARQANAPRAALDQIATQMWPTLRYTLPAVMLQWAELEGALAEVALDAKNRGQDAPDLQNRLTRAGWAFFEVALWQEQHFYLDQVPDTLARAQAYARTLKGDANLLRACENLKTILAEWSHLRGQYLQSYHALHDAPDDPRANADFARILIFTSQGIPPLAQKSLAKVTDPTLRALGDAVAIREPFARAGAVGLALIPLVEAANTPREKWTLQRLAIQNLDLFVHANATANPNFTRARLSLTRLTNQSRNQPIPLFLSRAANHASPPTTDEVDAASPIFGETTAHRVVYLLDGSGSMMNKFDTLRKAVSSTVAALKPNQLFNVVVMHEDEGAPFSRQSLPATDANKKLFYAFIKKTQPHGSSDPIPALRYAFAQNPEAIYFLTDGDFPNNNQVIAEIARLNANHRTKIHTIAFGEHGEEYEKMLRRIADQNGGAFRYVANSPDPDDH